MFAGPVGAELTAGGALGFPDLELLQTAEQIVIGSPRLLAIEYGTFSHDKLRDQATKQNFTRHMLKNAELWINPLPGALSVAYVSEKLLLVGGASTLESEITRVADPKSRSYSPLLARGARYIKEDLWIVASQLPDPLASTFVPFNWEATAFEGAVSAWDGLHAVAAVERSTPTGAMDLVDSIAMSLASRPAMAEGTEITTHDRSVLIRMDLDDEQLAESMHRDQEEPVVAAEPIHTAPPVVLAAAPAPAKATPAKAVAAKPAQVPAKAVQVKALPIISVVAPAPVSSVPAAPPATVASVPVAAVKPQPRAFVAPGQPQTTPAIGTTAITLPDVDVRSDIALKPQGSAPQSTLPPKPRVIRIVGLDDGPREILIDKVVH
jgi:hypothetical protein